MFKRTKIKQISSAKELLRVDSINTKISKTARVLLVSLVSCIFLLLFTGGLFLVVKDAPLNIKMAWAFMILLIYIVTLLFVTRIITRSAPLIITERGFVIGSYSAEFWEDIEEYGWETFKGWGKISFSPHRAGICLYIKNKGYSQRNLENWTGHSMLAQYGIFFTPEQIAETDKIFQQHGIPRIKGMEYKAEISKTETKKSKNLSRLIFAPIMLYVVIPTVSVLSLSWFRFVKFDFTTCAIIFGVIDTAMIAAILWVAKSKKNSSEQY